MNALTPPPALTLHLEQPPDIYFVDENFHVVDRVAGRVVVHRIFPATVIDQLADRAEGVGAIAKLLRQMSGRGRKGQRKHKAKR